MHWKCNTAYSCWAGANVPAYFLYMISKNLIINRGNRIRTCDLTVRSWQKKWRKINGFKTWYFKGNKKGNKSYLRKESFCIYANNKEWCKDIVKQCIYMILYIKIKLYRVIKKYALNWKIRAYKSIIRIIYI